MSAKIDAGVLGATGTVGQEFIAGLADHPWFTVTWIGASERSAGRAYRDATPWRLPTPRPDRIADMTVDRVTPGQLRKTWPQKDRYYCRRTTRSQNCLSVGCPTTRQMKRYVHFSYNSAR